MGPGGLASARLLMSPQLNRTAPQPAWVTSAMRAGSARLPRAAAAKGRKLGPERPGLCWEGRGRQRQLPGYPEGGTMGDDMDAIVPEREMKVRDWPGPPCLR